MMRTRKYNKSTEINHVHYKTESKVPFDIHLPELKTLKNISKENMD